MFKFLTIFMKWKKKVEKQDENGKNGKKIENILIRASWEYFCKNFSLSFLYLLFLLLSLLILQAG